MRPLAVVIALIVCCAAPGAAQRAAKPAAAAVKPVVHKVTIDATSFSPATLTIRPGDSVEWTNKDLIPHTATAAAKGGFDSGAMATGKTWRHTFKTAGDQAYACTFHPAMKGMVHVRK